MLFISEFQAVESLIKWYIQQFLRLFYFYNHPFRELMDTQIRIADEVKRETDFEETRLRVTTLVYTLNEYREFIISFY